MRAAFYDRYGPPDVIEVRDVPRPVPKPDEVLVRVIAASVTSGDWRLRAGEPFLVRLVFGLRGPRNFNVLGNEFSGVIDSVGSGVTDFKPGDAVFGGSDEHFGANAEYLCVPADSSIAAKPPNLTHDRAACIPFGGLTALHFLRDKAGIQSGQRVLIHGASGSVGTAAVQIARHLGAEVTGVCSSANLDMVRELGAQWIVDYTREDFRKGGVQYDVVFDAAGKAPFSLCQPVLGRESTYVSVDISPGLLLRAALSPVLKGPRIIIGEAKQTRENMQYLANLVESGAYQAVVDRRYPLDEIADAHAYVQKGHKRGNVSITVAEAQDA